MASRKKQRLDCIKPPGKGETDCRPEFEYRSGGASWLGRQQDECYIPKHFRP